MHVLTICMSSDILPFQLKSDCFTSNNNSYRNFFFSIKKHENNVAIVSGPETSVFLVALNFHPTINMQIVSTCMAFLNSCYPVAVFGIAGSAVYIANQFGSGVKHAETVAEAFKSVAADFKSGVAVFEAGEQAYEAAVEASKTNFEAGTVAFQSTIAEHIGKHFQNFVKACNKAVCVIGVTHSAAILGGFFCLFQLSGPHGWALSWRRRAKINVSGKIF
jgi:hypothetical protein